MASPNVNLQDSFLNHVRKESVVVEVLLLDGTSFQGVVRGFDNFTVVLHIDNKQHLVYKHAIAQLVAPKPTASPRSALGGERSSGSGKKREPAAKQVSKFNALDLSNIKLNELDESVVQDEAGEKEPPNVSPEA